MSIIDNFKNFFVGNYKCIGMMYGKGKWASSDMKNIWDRVSDLIIKAFNAEPGKSEAFKELGDFDDIY